MDKSKKTEPWQILVSVAAGPIFVLAYTALRHMARFSERLTFAEELGVAAVIGMAFAVVLYIFMRLVNRFRKGN
jgi:hypothetical protein